MVSIEKLKGKEPYELLNGIIEKEIASLKAYSNKPDSKQSAIDIKNDLILKLSEVLNTMEMNALKYNEIWRKFEDELAAAKKIDPSINCYYLILKTNENVEKPFRFCSTLTDPHD